MILGFTVPGDFSHSGLEALMQSCRELQAAYPQQLKLLFLFVQPFFAFDAE